MFIIVINAKSHIWQVVYKSTMIYVVYLNNILLPNALHKPNGVQHAELKQSIISQFRRSLVAIRIKPGSALRMWFRTWCQRFSCRCHVAFVGFVRIWLVPLVQLEQLVILLLVNGPLQFLHLPEFDVRGAIAIDSLRVIGQAWSWTTIPCYSQSTTKHTVPYLSCSV